jgi:transcriptional regulator with XRE-family HTH domain
MKAEKSEALGVMMDRMMDEAGLTPADVASRLRVTRTSVYRWLGGQRIPSEDVLRRFAGVVEKPPAPLLAARQKAVELNQAVEYVAIVLDWVLSGESPEDAIRRSLADGVIISPEHREELAAITAELRQTFAGSVGGRWYQMSREDRLRVVQTLIEMARTGRRDAVVTVSLKHPISSEPGG